MVTESTCSIDGCVKPVRSKNSEWCAMHYHRWYRHGDPTANANESGVSVSHGRRYRSLYLPSHPLASQRNGKVYEHRAVLFDVIGYGPHSCHWCGVHVNWARRAAPFELQVDHLDGFGDNNDPGNLVPSCRNCNTGRGSQARSLALRAAGWWSNNDTIAAARSQNRRPPVVVG